MLVFLIVACEIGFWVLLAAGLTARYVLGRRRLGGWLIAAVPAVDLVLLAATTADLAGGATAHVAHGLAAAYLGFSLAFGHRLVQAADHRFARRFGKAEVPKPSPLTPWQEWQRALAAWAIACALLLCAIAVVGDAGRTAALADWILWLSVILAVWALRPIIAAARHLRPPHAPPHRHRPTPR